MTGLPPFTAWPEGGAGLSRVDRRPQGSGQLPLGLGSNSAALAVQPPRRLTDLENRSCQAISASAPENEKAIYRKTKLYLTDTKIIFGCGVNKSTSKR